MKASIIGAKYKKKSPISIYSDIKDILIKEGVKVNYSYFDTSIAEDVNNIEATYKRNKALIKDCDFLIAESTLYGSGIGYLIAEAMNNKKPVLALYSTSRGDQPSTAIQASSISKLLTFKKYQDNKNLTQEIKSYIKQVKQKLDTKFILIISPEIDRYLEWNNETRRMHKAQTVRNAVEDMIRKDKEYKEYLKTA